MQPVSNYISSCTVMVVDDTESNIDILVEALGGDFNLQVAMDGETALEVVSCKAPDLILLDIMMPGMDGFEVCRRLKANPETREIPVIFLSALDDTRDKVRGLQLGAVDYVAKPFQPEEVIARVSTHLTIHRLSREVRRQRDELEHELQVVSRIQRDLLPGHLPRVQGLKLAVHYETSRYAGGDYYDFMQLPEGLLAVLVADAEGHSAPAAVMMAMTCTLFRSCSTGLDEPGSMLSFINDNLCKVNRDSFVTAVYAVFDTARRTVKIACAGHPLPILHRVSEKSAAEIPCDSVTLMGLGSYADVPVTEIALRRGDRLLFYTDGVTDRFNASQERYGTERLLLQFADAVSHDPEAILKEIIDDLSRFAEGCPAGDDQAMLVFAVE